MYLTRVRDALLQWRRHKLFPTYNVPISWTASPMGDLAPSQFLEGAEPRKLGPDVSGSGRKD